MELFPLQQLTKTKPKIFKGNSNPGWVTVTSCMSGQGVGSSRAPPAFTGVKVQLTCVVAPEFILLSLSFVQAMLCSKQFSSVLMGSRKESGRVTGCWKVWPAAALRPSRNTWLEVSLFSSWWIWAGREESHKKNHPRFSNNQWSWNVDDKVKKFTAVKADSTSITLKCRFKKYRFHWEIFYLFFFFYLKQKRNVLF